MNSKEYEKLIKWLDRDAILDLIIEELEDTEFKVNSENVKEIWYETLENLYKEIRHSIDWLSEKNLLKN